MRNTRDLLFEWASDLGQSPSAGVNELQLYKMIALGRGLTGVANWNEVKTLRGIASTYGMSAVGFNELKCLRAIVVALGATPANRYVSNLNELDCLRAIVGAGFGDHWVTESGDHVVTESGERIPV